jgi:hypothetical protein
MSRGHELRTPSPGPAKQRAELQQGIAVKTGIWGLALEVVADKIGNDLLGEFVFDVEDIEGNLQLVGYISCIFNRSRGTTSAALLRLPIQWLTRPQPEGNPYDLVSFRLQQSGREGAIHPSAHRHHDPDHLPLLSTSLGKPSERLQVLAFALL